VDLFPDGMSRSEISQSHSASKSASEIHPSRKRSTRCFMKYGGGFLIFGILVMPVEDDPLELFGQATEFAIVVGFLNSLQTEVESLLRSANGSGSRSSLTGPIAKPLPPSHLNGIPRALATLFGSEFGGSRGTALLAAFPPEGNSGRIFPLYVGGHLRIIRERSRKDFTSGVGRYHNGGASRGMNLLLLNHLNGIHPRSYPRGVKARQHRDHPNQ
jgi:hypothetical protein